MKKTRLQGAAAALSSSLFETHFAPGFGDVRLAVPVAPDQHRSPRVPCSSHNECTRQFALLSTFVLTLVLSVSG
jgi:hypothetical protein